MNTSMTVSVIIVTKAVIFDLALVRDIILYSFSWSVYVCIPAASVLPYSGRFAHRPPGFFPHATFVGVFFFHDAQMYIFVFLFCAVPQLPMRVKMYKLMRLKTVYSTAISHLMKQSLF